MTKLKRGVKPACKTSCFNIKAATGKEEAPVRGRPVVKGKIAAAEGPGVREGKGTRRERTEEGREGQEGQRRKRGAGWRREEKEEATEGERKDG